MTDNSTQLPRVQCDQCGEWLTIADTNTAKEIQDHYYAKHVGEKQKNCDETDNLDGNVTANFNMLSH